MNDVVILGGGISSLASAYYLAKKGKTSVILEKSSGIGGMAGSYRLDGFSIEKFYHHIFPNDAILLSTLEELGISRNVVWKNSSMAFYHKGQFHRFTTPFDLLTFRPLSIVDRLRFAKLIARIYLTNDWGDLDRKTAKDFLVASGGRKVYEVVFKPLLRTKFGMSMDRASAAFLHGRIKERVKSRSKSMLKEVLGYYMGSYGAIVDAFENSLKKKCEIVNDADVRELTVEKEGFRVRYSHKDIMRSVKCSQVLNTLALPVFLNISKGLPENYAKMLARIEYQSVVCAVFVLRRKLTDFYWVNISDDSLPFGVFLEHTNFIGPEFYGGKHIVYLAGYFDRKHRFAGLDDREILGLFREGLMRMFPNLLPEDIVAQKISRDKFATPVFVANYSSMMPSVKAPVRGLYMAGSSQIYPYSRSTNQIMRVAFMAAQAILDEGT